MRNLSALVVACVLLALVSVTTDARGLGPPNGAIARVSNFAGNGRAGIVDGPRASAEFILPSALAIDSSGNLYIADAAAQRIRVVRANGFVATLAGSGPVIRSGLWVTPGYKDGPAPQAQFNRPSGIAVAGDGRIYVADTYNHCIRLISRGIVSTYAGKCGVIGTKDGFRSDATLSYPRQLAIASDGALYVADFSAGIRKIDTAGFITTLPIVVDKRLTGLSIGPSGQIIISDVGGLVFYNPHTNETKRVPSFYSSQTFPPPIAGGLELGIPYSLAAEGSGRGVFFTDLRSDAVKYFENNGFLTYLNGIPREDAVLGNAWQTATPPVLHGPMGIAFDHGTLYVADSGHKRIVKIDRFNHDSLRGFMESTSLLKLQPHRREYRILIIGNSFVWFTDDERQSIGAHIEEQLLRDGALRAAGRVPRVFSMLAVGGLRGQPSLAKELIAPSNIDFVLIFANSFDLGTFQPDPNWGSLFHDVEAKTVEGLKGTALKSMFVVIPASNEATPLEQLYETQNLAVFDSDYLTVERLLMRELQTIGPPVLNLYPAVRMYEASPFVRPLYSNEDLHPSAYGRKFFAEHIASRLEQLRPWDAK